MKKKLTDTEKIFRAYALFCEGVEEEGSVIDINKMNCTFEDFDVAYDSDEEVEEDMQKAAKFNVEYTLNDDKTSATCKGTVENCLNFLEDYMKGDYGYNAGAVFFIDDAEDTDEFKNAFTKFIDEVSEKYEDFGTAVKEVSKMNKYI